MNQGHELDGLLDQMLIPAMFLIGAVRSRSSEDVAAVIGGMTRDELLALVVTISCMVPEDQSLPDLVAWTHGPEGDQVTGQLALDELAGRTTEHVPSKRCSRCNRYLPLTAFHRGTVRNRYGRKARCKGCEAEARRDRIRAAAEASGEAVKAA